jgi:hypothetical protein
MVSQTMCCRGEEPTTKAGKFLKPKRLQQWAEQAFREVADRLDGKSKIQQEISGPDGVALITEVRHLIVDPPMRLEE